jgi:hypothetical protein
MLMAHGCANIVIPDYVAVCHQGMCGEAALDFSGTDAKSGTLLPNHRPKPWRRVSTQGPTIGTFST